MQMKVTFFIYLLYFALLLLFVWIAFVLLQDFTH